MKKQAEVVQIQSVSQQTYRFYVVGTSPLIMNRMTEKVKNGLLVGNVKKTAADKAGVAKHNPLDEYRSSVYRMPDFAKADTILGIPSSAFKSAMQTAALETPGTKKAQIGRLVSVPWVNCVCYGEPKIFMAVTRNSDIARTPDVRTRAILPKWAAIVEASFVVPAISHQMVATLLSNAGLVAGIGDFRQEKGHGSFGLFRITNEDDPDFLEIVKTGSADVQKAALADPLPFDVDTEDLLNFFDVEVRRRQLKVV